MAPKVQNKITYKDNIQLHLDNLEKQYNIQLHLDNLEKQKLKVDLTKHIINKH